MIFTKSTEGKISVPLTAQALDISPNTVYLHLRNVRQEEDA